MSNQVVTLWPQVDVYVGSGVLYSTATITGDGFPFTAPEDNLVIPGTATAPTTGPFPGQGFHDLLTPPSSRNLMAMENHTTNGGDGPIWFVYEGGFNLNGMTWEAVLGRQIRSVQTNLLFGYDGTDASNPGGPGNLFFQLCFGQYNNFIQINVDIPSSSLIADSTENPPVGTTAGYVGSLCTANGSRGFLYTDFIPAGHGGDQSIFLSLAVSSGQQIDFTSAALNVAYNDPPSALPSILGLSSGVVPSLAPTISWNYSDPESDNQAIYRVVIFKASTVAASSFPQLFTADASQTVLIPSIPNPLANPQLLGSPITLPLTVVTGTNDTFNTVGEPWTIAAGTYTTMAEVALAMAAAPGGGADFGYYITPTIYGNRLLLVGTASYTPTSQSVTAGTNDVAADLGFGGSGTTNFNNTPQSPTGMIYDSGPITSSVTALTVPTGVLNNYAAYTVFVLVSDTGSSGRYNTVLGRGINTTPIAITAVSVANPTHITAAGHGLITGDAVVIAGTTTTPSINGTQVVTVIDSSHFTIPIHVTAVSVGTGTVTNQPQANVGLDFQTAVEPTLMPAIEFPTSPGSPSLAFDPNAGRIDDIVVRARLNLLTTTDADFVLSTGNWAITSDSTGSPSAPAWTNETVPGGLTERVMVITAVSSGGTAGNYSIGAHSGIVTVSAGEVLTAEAKIKSPVSTLPFARVGIEFFSDAIGTTAVGPTVYCSPQSMALNSWVKDFVQARVPNGAITARLKVLVAGANASEMAYIFEASIAMGVINLLDDASFEQSGSSNASFWEDFNGTVTFVDIPGASWPSGDQSVQLTNPGAVTAQVMTTAALGVLTGGISLLGSVDAQLVSGVATASLGVIWNTTFSVPTIIALTSAWSRLAFPLTGSAIVAAAGSDPAHIAIESATTGASVANFDNIQLEMAWPFIGGFLVPLAGSPIPTSVALGWPTGVDLSCTSATGSGTTVVTTPTAHGLVSGTQVTIGGMTGSGATPVNGTWTATVLSSTTFSVPVTTTGNGTAGTVTSITGQFWQRGDSNGGTCTIDNVVQQPSGAQSLKSVVSPTDGPASIEQIFTVSGWLSFQIQWYESVQTCGTSVCQLEFRDSAGVLLSQAFVSDAVISPLTIDTMTGTAVGERGTFTINVPANAQRCRISFINTNDGGGVNTSTVWVSNVVITPTGNLATSTPWMDGGWSAGGYSQNGTVQVGLQRSQDLVNWAFVRQPPNPASLDVAVVGPNFENDFTDYEYPGGTRSVPQFFYYQAIGLYSTGNGMIQSPLGQIIEVTNLQSFAPTEWILGDPLYPTSNILLQVKKASFKTAENQTVLMPAGRGRKVVMGDTQIFGNTITLELLTITPNDYTLLQTQYLKVTPLILRSPDGEFWYVRLTDRSRERVWTGPRNAYRTYSLTMETVDIVP
jgi:hypothetical protein